MTVRHMRVFVEVYRAGSITRAAEKLHVTQPAVTRAVQELEEYYGVHLFERMNRRLQVTECGRQLYEQAVHIVELFDDMEQELRNWDTLGVLRVGASITLGNDLLPGLAAEFRQTHPQLRVQVKIENGAALQRELADNTLDLAMIEGGADRPELLSRQFSTDHLTLIVPPEHPLLQQQAVHLADLLGYDLLMREQGSAGRAFVDNAFALRGLTPHPLWESGSTAALVKAVARGLGISVLPEKLVRQAAAAGHIVLCPVCDEAFTRPYCFVWHKNKYLTKAAKDWMSLCCRIAAAAT